MGINTDTDVQQGVLANTRTFGSNKVNDIRFGLSRLVNAHISPRANTVNVVKDLGINLPSDNPLYWGVPNIGITGIAGLGEESDAPFINFDTTIQLVDNFSWTLGKHSWKFGGEVRRVRYNQIGGVVTRGRFNFDGRYTQKPQLLAQSASDRGSAAPRSPTSCSAISTTPRDRSARPSPTSARTTSRSICRTTGRSRPS